MRALEGAKCRFASCLGVQPKLKPFQPKVLIKNTCGYERDYTKIFYAVVTEWEYPVTSDKLFFLLIRTYSNTNLN